MRLLIVEDDPVVAESLGEYLSGRGHTALAAKDGEEGLRKMLDEAPDAAFVDVVLPKLSGLRLLERLKHLGRSLPVIAISGQASEKQAQACLRLGALDYVAKPFTLSRLDPVLDLLEATLSQEPRGSAFPSA